MAKSHLSALRRQAFERQKHRCHYCGFLMWESEPDSFARHHGISLATAKRFQCTAEHLVPKQDGGKNTAANIVAACAFCNHGRHKCQPAPSPDKLKQKIAKRLAHNRWHPWPAVSCLSLRAN